MYRSHVHVSTTDSVVAVPIIIIMYHVSQALQVDVYRSDMHINISWLPERTLLLRVGAGGELLRTVY